MNLERLAKLADFLRTVPTERFYMPLWYCGGDATGCGTAACAMGWATYISEFQALGLQRKLNKPEFQGQAGLFAAMQFLDITHKQSKDLFLDNSYSDIAYARDITPDMVADKIDALICANCKEMKNAESGKAEHVL